MLSAGCFPSNCVTLTHAVGTADLPAHMGSVDTLGPRSHIVERRRPVAVAGTEGVGHQQADTQSAGAEDLPFAAASCEADRTGQAGLAPGSHLDRFARLLVVGVRLPASFDFRPPSFSPSILCESP